MQKLECNVAGAPVSKPTLFAFFAKLVIGAALSLRYRIKPRGMENIPDKGAAILLPNHVSFIDALAIGKHCPRPIRFVMAKSIYDHPILNPLLRPLGVIPIAGAKEDPEALARAYESVSAALRNGELVCIFPEGQLTKNGEIGEFKSGFMKILVRDPVPIVPLALGGLWGSIFTRRPQGALHLAKRVLGRRRIVLEAGAPIPPEQAQPAALRDIVVKMRGAKR